MAKWTQESALSEIESLMDEIVDLSKYPGKDAQHTHWLLKSYKFLQEVFGENSLYYRSFVNIQWSYAGPALVTWREAFNPTLSKARYDHPVYINGLQLALGILSAAQEDLVRNGLDAVYHGKNTGPEASLLLRIMHLAESKLRKTIRQIPEREKEVQDAFESLLIGADIDYSREKETIEYSSKNYIPDFTVDRADLAIDIKLCDSDKREKQIIPEINDDILAYKTKYDNLMFVVYDCGFIRDVDRFSGSFEAHGAIYVKIVKH